MTDGVRSEPKPGSQMAGSINCEDKRQYFVDMKGKKERVGSEKDTFIFRCGAEN